MGRMAAIPCARQGAEGRRGHRLMASAWGHVDAVRFLLSKGADTTLKDKEGKTALDVASRADMRALLSRGK
jgi:ankyrin repeat protein